MKTFICEPYNIDKRLNGEGHRCLIYGDWKRIKTGEHCRFKTKRICRYHIEKLKGLKY